MSWSHFVNDGAANFLPGVLPAILIGLNLPVALAGTLMACPGPVMAEAGRITAALQAAQRLVPQPDGTVRLEAAGQPALTLRPQAG